MKQLQLPFPNELKVGDKVRVLSKSIMHNQLPFHGTYEGTIAYIGQIAEPGKWISSIDRRIYWLKSSMDDRFCRSGTFAAEDLERIYK